MTVIATVEQIRDRNGYSNMNSVNDAALSATLAASSTLASVLRTSLDEEAGVVDLFYISEMTRVGQNLSVSLKTSRGFIKSSPAVQIKAAHKSQWFTTGDGTVDDVRDVSGVDYSTVLEEKGLIIITGFDLRQRFVQVTYDCGFATSGDPPVYQSTPQWLIDAALLVATASVEKNPALRSEESDPPQVGDLLTQANAIIERKVRYEPGALHPLG